MTGRTSVIIRPGVAGDLSAVRRVFRNASLSNSGDREVLLEHPWALEFEVAQLTGGHCRVAVEPGGEVVGFATAVPDDGGLELEDLFVDPSWMRRGVARRLIADVVDRARALGVGKVMVTGNPHAADFYAAIGFRVDGVAQTEFGEAPRLRLDVQLT